MYSHCSLFVILLSFFLADMLNFIEIKYNKAKAQTRERHSPSWTAWPCNHNVLMPLHDGRPIFLCTFWHFLMASQESVFWSRVKEGDLQGTFVLLLLRRIASETLDNLIPVLLTGRNFHLRTCAIRFLLRLSKVWALISLLNSRPIHNNCGRNLPLYFDTDRSSFFFFFSFLFCLNRWVSFD